MEPSSGKKEPAPWRNVRPTQGQAAEARLRPTRVSLKTSLFYNGLPEGPHGGDDWSEILGLYPTTFGAEVYPPFLIIRLREIPPKPWPLTVGGMPVWFSSDQRAHPFHRGQEGRGKEFLQEEFNLREQADVDNATINTVTSRLIDKIGTVFDVFWWLGGFWTITVADDADVKTLPMRVGGAPAFYTRQTYHSKSELSALRSELPKGIDRVGLPHDVGLNEASPGESYDLLLRSVVFMDNPDSHRTEGLVVGTGVKVIDVVNRTFAGHNFLIFQNGEKLVDGSYRSPIWDENDRVIGFCCFQETVSDIRYCLSEKASHGYRIVEASHASTE